MRWGLEQSRNLMTVRTANMTGMDRITKLARTLGVGDYPNYLSIALGAGETTVLQMTNAFAILANNGKEVKPTMIDYIQERHGKEIGRASCRERVCQNVNITVVAGLSKKQHELSQRHNKQNIYKILNT